MQWDGARWWVRDLGSTNGTQVGGRRLASSERSVLETGAVVTFGTDEERWTLEEGGPPTASARAEATGEVRTAEDGLLVLPDVADPLVTLAEDRQGRWMLEIEGGTRTAMDQERIHAGGIWTLHIPVFCGERVPTTSSSSRTPELAAEPVLRFEVSRDEEYITLSLVHRDEVTALGDRAYHEVLLALARARRADQQNGLPTADQGWMYVDDLLEMLKIDLKHFNVNIFRARQNLARVGMLDVSTLVERRSTTRQIRIGLAVEIVQMSQRVVARAPATKGESERESESESDK